MPQNSILSIFLMSALSSIAPGCETNEPHVQITPSPKLLSDVRRSANALIEANQQPEFDPPQLLLSDAFEARHGTQISTFIPTISAQISSEHNFLTQCRLIEIKKYKGQLDAGFIERKESGFSDDYEPCVAISAPTFIDVNEDGTQDVVFAITRISGTRKEYVLGDVYLFGSDARLCHSPEASTAFMPENQEPISKKYIERIVRSERKRLASLQCSASK